MSTSPVEQPRQSQADARDRRLAMLPLRERKKLRTRRAIQDHALRLFAAQGYDETTVEQIAAAAEVSPSTFFRYFPTKEDVVITDEYDPIMAELFRAQPAGLSPLEALRGALRSALDMIIAEDYDLLLIRVELLTGVPAVRARHFEAMRGGTMAVIAELAAERTGRSPGDPEVDAFAWAAIGVLQGALYAWLDSGRTIDLLERIDRNLEFLGRGCPL